jgi:hypothetical protein
MGKTIPSTTQLILDTIAEMLPFYEGLPGADQRRLDMILKRVSKHKVAISNARPLRPIIVLTILMVLEIYKFYTEIFHAQYEEMKRMRKAMEAAGIFIPEETPAIEAEDDTVLELFSSNIENLAIDQDLLQISE